MVRFVAAGTAGVARCAPIGTQLATNRLAPQPGMQPPRNTDPPVLYERQAVPAQQVAQPRRNSSATAAPQIQAQELRAATADSGTQPLDIFAPEFTADPDVHKRWVVTIPGRDPFGVIVFPDANLAQMRAQYPTAVSIHPDPDEHDSESTEGKHR